MATFKYYNIQFLPTKKLPMIGEQGYQKVFAKLKEQTEKVISLDAIDEGAFSLRNDFYLSPLEVHIENDIAYGRLLKFDKVDKVVGTLSNETKYTSDGKDSSKKYEFRFVFDFSLHILAIEKHASLPSANILIEFLIDQLEPIKNKLFESYSIHIKELTCSEQLDLMLKGARKYRSVDVELTYSNSQDWSEFIECELLKSTEAELKENNIHEVHHTERAASKSFMSKPSGLALVYLVLALKYGNAKVQYQNDDGRLTKFMMKDHPVTLRVNEKEKGSLLSDKAFAEKVKSSIDIADKKTVSGGAKAISNLNAGADDEEDFS